MDGLNLSVNLKSYTKFIRYIAKSRAEGFFIKLQVDFTILSQGIKDAS